MSIQAGHDIEAVARRVEEGENPDACPEDLLMSVDGYDDADTAYKDDYRFLALRGPLMLQSWGYDLAGKPVPNAADTESNTEQGIFQSAGLQDNFMENFLKKSKS